MLDDVNPESLITHLNLSELCYIGVFWFIFNLGGFVGGMLQFELNFEEEGKMRLGHQVL